MAAEPVGLGPHIRRRSLLIGGALVLAGGCTPSVSTAPPPLGQVGQPVPAAQAWTIADLLGSTPFHVAHRGSGDNWPEHTMTAYAAAVELGARAIEVSVCATRDGVLVCHHDLGLARTTGVDRAVSELTWDEVRELRVDARRWLGPNTPLEPIPQLTEVLDAFAGRCVIFLEDKTGERTRELLDLLDTHDTAGDRVVWKQWAGANQHSAAAGRGYRTWGYVTEDLLDRLDELAPEFDLLGVSHLASDETIAAVVATGRPVIAWEVHFRSVRDRLTRLGVQGMMTSNLPYVAELVAPSPSDAFASGRRAAGDLPWSTDRGWAAQPDFDPLTRSISLTGAGLLSYHLGSMTPIGWDAYRLRFEMRWPDHVPGSGHHAGLAFGQLDDSDYRPLVPSTTGGYHLVLRKEGALQLFARAPGDADATLLTSVSTLPPEAGEWIELQLDVTRNGIRASRQGRDPWTLTSDDTTYRGSYFSLVRNYTEATAVEFRGIHVDRL